MKLILLGGISVKNKAWIEEVERELAKDFATEVVDYDHWATGGEEMDFGAEAVKLERMCRVSAEYVILAKSGGSWLTLKLMAEGKIKPVKIILVGPAWNWARNNGFDPIALAKKVTVPVLVVDKTNDPSLSFGQLKKEVEEAGLTNFTLVEMPGDTHHYENVEKIGKLIREFAENS